MDQKTLIKVVLAILVLAALIFYFTKGDSEKSPTVDNNLQGNISDETRQVNDEIANDEKPRDITHAHVEPGVYSEIYYTVGNLKPGTDFKATLYQLEGDDENLVNAREEKVIVDESGVARFVWRINQFGGYAVSDQEIGAGTTILHEVK